MSQNFLYGKAHERHDFYSYEINSGGQMGVYETGKITIHFIDGQFSNAHFPFSGTYTRNGWRILAEIERRITAIEESLKGET